MWDAYPRRGGGNSKRAAFRAYSARIRAGTDVGVLLDGVRRYAEFIRATGREGTEFVLQAATFFGPSEHWADDWTLPTASTRSAVLPNHDGEADAAWRSVLALIPAWQRRDPDVANRYRALGPATIHAMSAVGGMQILAETPDDKRHFKHRSFVAAFQTSSQAGAA